MFNKNDRVRVSNFAPHWAGKEGYFQFICIGKIPGEGIAVISETPDTEGEYAGLVLYAVKEMHVESVRYSEEKTSKKTLYRDATGEEIPRSRSETEQRCIAITKLNCGYNADTASSDNKAAAVLEIESTFGWLKEEAVAIVEATIAMLKTTEKCSSDGVIESWAPDDRVDMMCEATNGYWSTDQARTFLYNHDETKV